MTVQHDTERLLFTVAGTARSWLVLGVRGEIDISNADMLTTTIITPLLAGHHQVLLDLSGVGFASCAGLRAIVRAHQAYLDARGSLVVTGVAPAVMRSLFITGLNKELTIADDRCPASSVDQAPHV